MTGWSPEELQAQVDALEMELGRRDRQMDALRARTSELEMEVDRASDELKQRYRELGERDREVEELRCRLADAERRADYAERSQRGHGY